MSIIAKLEGPDVKPAVSSVRQFYSTVLGFLITLALAGCSTTPVSEAPSGILYQRIDAGAHPIFRSVVETATAEDWAPMNATVDPATESIAAFRLDLDFRIREKPLHDTEAIWTMTTLLLFTVYPSTCARYDLELTADLRDSSGSRIKSWHLLEQDTAFLWLFQGGDCMGQAESTIRTIAETMLKNLYGRMKQEGILSAQAVAPVDQLPLVHVSAENAEALVQRVTKTDAPFENFTFKPTEGQSVDRILNVRFDFVRADPSVGAIIGRGMAAVMTIGVVGVCAPNDMILNAKVMDTAGSTLREYRFGRKIRGSMANDCAPATDRTHPRQATDLLRQLFRQIEEDKVI